MTGESRTLTSVSIGESLSMKLGIISDTHDHLDHIRKAAAIFRKREVDLVVHAGDYTSPPAVMALDGLKTAGVFGNNDGEKLGIARVFGKIGGRFEGDFLKIDADGEAVAVYHGTVPEITEALGRCGLYRAVISGHTHKIANRLQGRTRMLNPGSAHGFGKSATIMIYDADADRAEVMEL